MYSKIPCVIRLLNYSINYFYIDCKLLGFIMYLNYINFLFNLFFKLDIVYINNYDIGYVHCM
jgi:hypothetical protein